MTSATVTSLPTARPAGDRAVWRSVQYRAGDLRVDDVTRNSFGKWATVVSVSTEPESPYVTVRFDSGDSLTARRVHLVPVQEVKPS
ncbi:MAG: hypothetical protein ACXVYY_01140 [Oryzihumus sp.]